MIKKRFVIFFILVLASIFTICRAQTKEPNITAKPWSAQWITVPGESSYEYGVYLFRKRFELSEKPKSFIIHVSADNRYKLFVNGKIVSLGPARGDLSHWNFETVDIATYLTAGANIIAAQVWNEGEYRPEAQITFKTGFVLQGASNNAVNVSTNDTWLCTRDMSFAPLKFNSKTYFVAGAGEIRNMSLRHDSWQEVAYNDSEWKKAKPLFIGLPKDVLGEYGTSNGWMLVPSIIPQMELKDERFLKLIKIEGMANSSQKFPTQKEDIIIPEKSTVTILLDQSYLTNAYPKLIYSGGVGATLSLSYAEGLYTKYPLKGNRNDTDGKTFIGRKDSLLSDGTSMQEFTTLTYRTYRYLQLRISTQDDALTVHDVYSIFTGYPFQMNAHINTDHAEINKIMEVGWRTARLCAVETYMDCPYYEQLQYIGDGRIQALVSLYNSGDDRLVKNAIKLMDYSRQPEGVTMSRHPSYTPQYIPTFSLWYISMLQDYMRYGSDVDFVKNKMGGVREILKYFKSYQQADGSLKNVPQWMFTDWVEATGWKAGAGPMGKDGSSALIDLQLLLAYQTAADIESKIGMPVYAAEYKKASEVLIETIRNKYWHASKNLIADRAEKDLYSQHANSLAILTGVINKNQLNNVVEKLLSDTSLAPASVYFKYYLHQALIKAGMGNDYMVWLDKWRENLQMGLTTWAEHSNVDSSRSDCHAWGSSPNIEFFRTLLGIDSDGLSFSKVKIEPHLGDLKKASGAMPHPKGKISVSYTLDGKKWQVKISLPQKVNGSLLWRGKVLNLHAGENNLVL
jgi:alpha-L-rhamnosidase